MRGVFSPLVLAICMVLVGYRDNAGDRLTNQQEARRDTGPAEASSSPETTRVQMQMHQRMAGEPREDNWYEAKSTG